MRVLQAISGFFGGLLLMTIFPFAAAAACYAKRRWIWDEMRTLD